MVNAVNINSALRLSVSPLAPHSRVPLFLSTKKNSPGKHREGRTLLRSNPFLHHETPAIYIYIHIHTHENKKWRKARPKPAQSLFASSPR